MTGAGATRRRGRRPGDPADTRRTILEAARSAFADHGYERATIRMIASAANVDHALVLHHFSNKQQLFVAAHDLPADPSSVIAHVVSLPEDERGEAIARAFLDIFTAPDSAALSLLRAATTNADAAAMLREFVADASAAYAPVLIDGDDAEFRLALIMSHVIGVVIYRAVIGIEPFTAHSIDDIVTAIGPTIQHYLDGD